MRVPPAVQLVLTWPNSDGQDLGDRTVMTNTILGGDAQLEGQLEAVINLQEQPQGTEVLPHKAEGVDFRDSSEGPGALPDLVLVPMFQGEVHDRHKGKPGGHPEEPVDRLFWLLQKDGEAFPSDGAEETHRVS